MVMHRSPTAAQAAALWLALVLVLGQTPASLAWPGAPGAVEDAKRRLARDDARGAVAVLESALPGATAADRPALIDALRVAYAAAARQAEAEGRTSDADDYRENLAILDRSARPAAAAAAKASGSSPAPPSEATREPSPSSKPAADPKPKPEPSRPAVEPPDPSEPLPPLPPVAALGAPPALAAPTASPSPGPDDRSGATVALPQAPTVGTTPAAKGDVSLRAADAAFLAENYDEAGRIYTVLNRAGKLPDDRNGHWAYCRAVKVVRQINARPASEEEWAAIDDEIQQIRTLSPSNWFGEYLRNLAAERGRDPRSKAGRSNKVVVRGSSPDEPAPPRRRGARQAAPVPAPAPAQAPPPPPVSAIAWSRQPIETANFQVVHVEKDRALAERIAQAAEAAREANVKRWGSGEAAWTPRCEVVLFPNAQDFSRETLQPPDSPGFSTMGLNAGRIVLRRVHLRADHPNVLHAVLPHEVTHVVLADLFPHQQIPRWADEGMAVLAEPRSEQSLRAADLDEPLRSGRLFRLGDLMAMDYPDAKYWGLYYAQSVSLTRYLVESGSPAQFVKFVQQAQRSGIEPALRQVYSISGYSDLQSRWLSYAREKTAGSATLTASSGDPEKNPPPPRR
jgi:hypothetical protein